MKGSVAKRCACPALYDARGRRKACNKRHGSWTFVIDVGVNPATGKRRQLRKGGFRTQAEAESALAEAITQFETGQHSHDERLTVGTYLTRWLEEKSRSVRATTLRDYTRHVEVHLIPRLGQTRLRNLRTAHVSALLREL